MMDGGSDWAVECVGETGNLVDAVGVLYQASADARLWPLALARACRALGLRGMAVSVSTPTGFGQLRASHGISADGLERHANCACGQRDGLCIDHAVEVAGVGLTQTSHLKDLVCIPLRVEGARAARVVLRSAHAAHEAVSDLALAQIRPHLERCLEMALTTLGEARHRRELERDADALPYGRFVIEDDLRVRYANSAACAVAATADGLQLHEGRLRARRSTDHAALVAAIEACGRTSSEVEILLTIPRRSGRWPYAVRVASTPAGADGDQGKLFEVLVLDRNPEQGTLDPLLVHGFSLTPAEDRVLRLLMAGLGSEQIAVRAGIARGTVKVHVAHLLKKLGVHRQADIVQRMLQPLVASIPESRASRNGFRSEDASVPAADAFAVELSRRANCT